MNRKKSETIELILGIVLALYALHTLACDISYAVILSEYGSSKYSYSDHWYYYSYYFQIFGWFNIHSILTFLYMIATVLLPISVFIKKRKLLAISICFLVLRNLLNFFSNIGHFPDCIFTYFIFALLWIFPALIILDFEKDKKYTKYYYVSIILAVLCFVSKLIDPGFENFLWFIVHLIYCFISALICFWIKTCYDEDPSLKPALAVNNQSQVMQVSSIYADANKTADLIKEYKGLLDSGIISEEEFNNKKQEILSKI